MKFLNLTTKKNSLLTKLLTSFLIVIALLASFNIISFTFFKTNIEDEIRKYNSLNLNNTVQKYEDHLSIVSNTARGLFFDEKVHILTEQMHNSELTNTFYYNADKAVRQIQTLLSNNPYLYVDNLLLFYKNNNLIVNNNGVYSAEDFFLYYYQSDEYPLSFWDNEFQQGYTHKVLPDALFSEMRMNQKFTKASFIPVIIKNLFENEMYIVALLDSEKMFRTFHDSINDKFLIRNQEGRNIFTTDTALGLTELPSGMPAALTVDSRKVEGDYYFFRKGASSGFTYVNSVSDHHISSQIVHINVILFIFLLATLAIGIATSIFFSIRFNNPVKRIMQDIQQLNYSERVHSNIKEFDIIGDQVRSILKSSHEASKDLAVKTTIIKKFAIIEHLKQTYNNIHEIKVWNGIEKPYKFILFQLNFAGSSNSVSDADKERATCFIREFINRLLTERFPGSLTVQLEYDQILSVLFLEEDTDRVLEIVAELKKVFDLDREHYYLTISISSLLRGAADLTKAYEQVLEMVKQRKLNDETQIILTPVIESHPVLLEPAEENELYLNLLQGNASEVVKLVQRKMSQLNRRGTSAFWFLQVSQEIVQKVNKILTHYHIESEPFEQTSDRLKSFHQFEQFAAFFQQYLSDAAEQVVIRKEKTDRIVDFVTGYVENHYATEISLSEIADKLRVTNRYLSTYFKEKTGINFIDYLHELRIQKAKELLTETNLKIQEVTERVGYQNTNSFIRLFKKHSGLTPGEFRKNLGMGDARSGD
jgi:AraC-like DNA-binding protein